MLLRKLAIVINHDNMIIEITMLIVILITSFVFIGNNRINNPITIVIVKSQKS